jgi:hypothetical protein
MRAALGELPSPRHRRPGRAEIAGQRQNRCGGPGDSSWVGYRQCFRNCGGFGGRARRIGDGRLAGPAPPDRCAAPVACQVPFDLPEPDGKLTYPPKHGCGWRSPPAIPGRRGDHRRRRSVRARRARDMAGGSVRGRECGNGGRAIAGGAVECPSSPRARAAGRSWRLARQPQRSWGHVSTRDARWQ